MCSRCFKCVLILGLWLLTTSCAHQPPEPPQLDKAATMQRVQVPGGSLEYLVRGTGEPVLLIHGSIFADVFETMVPQPSLANYRLITYHRRGFVGSTRAPKPFTIDQQVGDAFALLNELGIMRAHVVGHSYGGTIALQMARQYPGRVASLVLLEPAVPSFWPPDPKEQEAVQTAMQIYARGDARGAVKSFSESMAPGAWEEMKAAGATAFLEQGVADAATFFEVELPALFIWPFTAADAAKLQLPALVVLGAQTTGGGREGHAGLLRALPRGEEAIIEGAGHELQMKQPQAVAEAIGTFLRKNPMQ